MAANSPKKENSRAGVDVGSDKRTRPTKIFDVDNVPAFEDETKKVSKGMSSRVSR